MDNVKALLGTIPSRIVASMIRRSAPAVKAANYVDIANSYPKWFQEVDRRVLVKTRFGFSIWCDRWDVIGQAIIRNGQWEGLLSRTILAALKPGDLAVDIGAKDSLNNAPAKAAVR